MNREQPSGKRRSEEIFLYHHPLSQMPTSVLIGKSASRITMGPNVRVKPAAWPGYSGLSSFTFLYVALQTNRG
ncbi:hypothetical protein C5615_37870 [Burkholderia cepacia]|uniref:Uncharacterized protein n=1 Tax=Burkholderia cepacia TaxID=292 RepID=A0A2S8HXR9_BURCE|nr:hypothetical protein C5615_37870 [Burkholderia cepacia]